MNPILGKRPSKLRKESNFVKFKQILGKHQNKIEEKPEPDSNKDFKNLIGIAEINRIYENFWDFLGKRPPKENQQKRALRCRFSTEMNPKNWVKNLFLLGFPQKWTPQTE